MPSLNLSQTQKSDMTKPCIKAAKTWRDLEDVEKHSSFTGLALITINHQCQFFPNRKLVFLSSICRWSGVTWKMFLCEYSCYPKPVLHLWGPVPFQVSKLAVREPSAPSHYCLLLLHNWRAEATQPSPPVPELFGEPAVCFPVQISSFCIVIRTRKQKFLWSHWLAHSVFVFRRQLAGRTLVITSVSVIPADAACWTGPDLLKCSSLWIVGFSNIYIKACANKSQFHPINS